MKKDLKTILSKTYIDSLFDNINVNSWSDSESNPDTDSGMSDTHVAADELSQHDNPVINKLYVPRSEQNVYIDDVITKDDNGDEYFEFLPIDWFECDINDPYAIRKKYSHYLNNEHPKTYGIYGFGVTKTGESVCVHLKNYYPYFYIQIPDDFTDQQADDLKTFFSMDDIANVEFDDMDSATDDEQMDIKAKSLYYKSAIKYNYCKFEQNKIFWSFMNGQLFKFLKIAFTSKNAYKFYSRYLKKEVDLDITRKDKPIKYLQYESNLDIILRFFHDSKIQPSNWIKIPKNALNLVGKKQSKCQINISCEWNAISLSQRDEIPPLIVASFDIEADSSHGDFPLARKDCKKLANQLVVAWIRDQRIFHKKEDINSDKYKKAEYNITQKDKFFDIRIRQSLGLEVTEKDNDIDLIYLKNPCLRDAVETSYYKNAIQLFYKICNRPITKIKADTRMKNAVNEVMNRQDKIIEKNGFISFDDFVELIDKVAKKEKFSNGELRIKIITKDIMVRFINQELNKLFGHAEGDRVIQIGTVFWRYGEEKPFHNNIITLRGCDPFKVGDNYCEVISKNRELDVLLEWAKLIKKYDPDIITGYNIFGFDETFMYDRLIELVGHMSKKKLSYEDIKILKENEKYSKFINLTRFTDDVLLKVSEAEGKLNLKKLASSALGENYLYYFNMPGRVQIDLLKVCQASMEKLPSYKLDDVAEHYISGNIVGFRGSLTKKIMPDMKQSKYLIVENIDKLEVGNFIVISMKTTGQKLFDGNKVKVVNIHIETIMSDEINKLRKDEKPRGLSNTGVIEIEEPVNTDCRRQLPKWGIGKDDVSPKDIFRLQKGSDSDRAIIAKYCIQDCALLIRLIKRMDIIPNNFGMSNVCLVPFSYIFMRGQGIKIFSLIVNECSMDNSKLPVLEKVEPDEEDLQLNDKNIRKANKNNQKNNNDDNDEGIDDDGGNGIFKLKSDFNVIKMTDDSYEGAIVLTPKPDIYTEPITVLDFGSLYPSEMIANDLSHDRLCEDPYWLGEDGAKRIRALDLDFVDISYDNFTWIDPNNHNKGKKKNGINIDRYIVNKKEKGLLSRILIKLLGARKATKNRIKKESDPNKKTILDGLQLAYKLTANSLYGQTGAKTSQIYKKSIAASTTAGGRKRIYTARDYCLANNPGCDVVYGDSVTGDTPIILLNMDTNYLEIVKIEDIMHKVRWEPYDNFKPDDKTLIHKQQKQCDNYMVYTNDGWGYLKRVIRHCTNKKIYRVSTATGFVDVTEDHSLLDSNLNEIKPTNLKVGDTRLADGNTFNINKDGYNYSETMCVGHSALLHPMVRVMGSNITYRNTSFTYPYPNIYGHEFKSDSMPSKSDLKQASKKSLKSIYEYIDGVIYSNKIKGFELRAFKKGQFDGIRGYKDDSTFKYKKSEYKHICEKYLNRRYYGYKFAYLCGFISKNIANFNVIKNDDTVNKLTLTVYTKIGMSILYYLVNDSNMLVNIEIKLVDSTNQNSDQIVTSNFNIEHPTVVKDIKFLRNTGPDEFVYDIETSSGNFNAGFPLIVKNTDSVFVKFNLQYEDGTYPETDLDKIKRSIEIGLHIQQKLKDDKVFPHPHDLEYEKVYYPLILITKKRYIGIKYEFNPEVGCKTSMGVVTKRRDNAPILKYSFIGVTDTLMQDKDIVKAVEFVRGVCRDMVDGLFELNMFILSKTLREYYKDPESIAHKVLADRMAERDPGNKPACNERLPYIYIKIDEQPGVSYLQGDRIEHANYVRDNNCKVDYETYITNQIMKPVSQIFELVVEKLPRFPYQKDYFNNLEIKYYNKYNGDLVKTSKKVSDLKHRLIKKLLFDDILTYAYNKAHNVNTIDNYFTSVKIDENKLKEMKKDINKVVDKTNKKEKFKIKRLKQISIDDMFS